MPRPLLHCALAAVLLALAAPPTRAQVVESPDLLVDPRTERALEIASERWSGFPQEPAAAEDLLVVFTTGAAYGQILAIGAAGTDPVRLGQQLEDAVAATGFRENPIL
ncbi:MAG: hypothetical protein FJX77_15930, partial [Armatimonadetes bacterium]|nr:hypothetical protein [Armatimonadota bacterium]